MKVTVRVTPNAKNARVIRIDATTFEVKVDERAKDGRANKRLLEIMSKYLDVPKSKIFIIDGAKSRSKTIEVAA